MKSVMNFNFSQIPGPSVQRSVFNRDHGYKTTMDAGYLVPFYVDEVLPGDTFSCNASVFARLSSALKFPVMDNIHLDIFFFNVNYRNVWENFKAFMGEKLDPDTVNTHTLQPVMTTPGGGFLEGSLADYFGIPTKVNGMDNICSLAFRAYNLIYNEWFRDQNLVDHAVVDLDDGPDSLDDYPLRLRCKRHDYFTSMLPWPQKGDAVELPIGGQAQVWGNGSLGLTDGTDKFGLVSHSGSDAYESINGYHQSIGATVSVNNLSNTDKAIGVVPYSASPTNYSGLYADLSHASAANINQLREAIQIQKFLEKDARGGTRYTEKIRSHFGVVSPDARQQRPEYLGGGSQMINIHTVPQTSYQSGGGEYKGSLAAYSEGFMNAGFSKSFTEHGLVMGLACVWCDLTYQHGIPKMFLRQTVYDHYWPVFAHLGEQEVERQELHANGTDADDHAILGYQERYAEYRYYPSKITGLFRENATGTLDSWHCSQHFADYSTGGVVNLDEKFILENPPLDRVVAVPAQPHIIFDSFIQLRCARPMPVYSVPGMMDHF